MGTRLNNQERRDTQQNRKVLLRTYPKLPAHSEMKQGHQNWHLSVLLMAELGFTSCRVDHGWIHPKPCTYQ